MSSIRRFTSSRFVSVSILASAAVALSACSGGVERFASYPNVATSSIQSPQVTKAVAGNTAVTTKPLANAYTAPQRPAWQQQAPQVANVQSTYQRPVAQVPAYQQPVQGQVQQAQAGSVQVQSGMTLYSIARANNVNPVTLANYNNIPAPYGINVGQTLRIPGIANPTTPAASFVPQSQQQANVKYVNTPKTASWVKQPAVAPAAAPVTVAASTTAGSHTVMPGQTLFAVGRKYGVNPYTIAKYNNLQAPYGLNAGQVLRIPAGGTAAVATAAPTAPAAPTTPVVRKAANTVAKTAPVQVAQAPVVKKSTARLSPQTTVADNGGNGSFRWPVNGRVISSYGPKSGGTRNEGINIAVPEGTSVRAAESGVVAYSGNELKGYGNLVLIRHTNGWVSAYAHNKELFVKRGATVKRGEVIAKAGQTGSVSSPQLHFELRKGASAVNPTKYLSSKTASAQ